MLPNLVRPQRNHGNAAFYFVPTALSLGRKDTGIYTDVGNIQVNPEASVSSYL